MNEEERGRAFEQAYKLLQEQYGFEFAAQVQVEQWGPKIECKPALIVQAIQGWTEPPKAPPAELPRPEHSNGKPILTDEEIAGALR